MFLALAEYLRKTRLENNISQRELAKISGVSNSEISKIESGQRQMPNPDILKKIAESLNIEYSILAQKCGYINYDNYFINYYDGNILIKTIDEIGEIKKQKYINTSEKIINKVVQKANKDLNVEFQIKYKIKHDFYFDAIAFNKYNDIFCLQVEYMNTQCPYYFIDNIINKFKSKFLDYYIYFKEKGNVENIYYQAVLVLDNVEVVQEIEHKLKQQIDLINKFFSYKIYLYDELISAEE